MGEMNAVCSVFSLNNRHKVCGWRHIFGVSEIRIDRCHHPLFGILLGGLSRNLVFVSFLAQSDESQLFGRSWKVQDPKCKMCPGYIE